MPTPTTSTFAQLYGDDCRLFLGGLIDEIKPDFVLTETRLGERAITVFHLLPSSFPKDKIFVMSSLKHRSDKRLESLLSGKRALLLDEAAERAISLAEHRAWLEKHGAVVVTAVLAIRQGGIDEQRIQEFPIRYALRLSDYGYRRFTATLLEALTVAGVSLDMDHLSLMLDIRDQNQVDELMVQTAQLGRIHNTRSYVRSSDTTGKFVVRGWTLDDPAFISLPQNLRYLQPEDSLFKLRFDSQPSGVRCVIIATNKMMIDPNDFSTSFLAHFGEAISMPGDWQEMTSEQKALYLYESTLLILAGEIFRQFTVVAKKGASTVLQEALDNAHIEEGEICAVFDRDIDRSVISMASDIAMGATCFPSDNNLPVHYTYPIPLISPFSSVLPRSANFNKVAIETLRKQLEAQTKADGYRGPSQLGLSRDTFAIALQRDYPKVDYVTFSRHLDEMLDQGMMKPHINIEQLPNGSFLCFRVYQLGERSGYKSPVPRSLPDKAGISRETFERSHSMTPGMRDSERAIVIMEVVAHHIATRLNTRSVTDILLNKVLSNMTLDWKPIEKETWPFTIRNFVFGTMVEAPSEPSSTRDRVPLGELASHARILKHDWRGAGDSTNHFPLGTVTLRDGEVDDYLAEKIEEFIPSELYQIRSFTDSYLEILSMENDSPQNPAVLVALAVGRSQRAAYAQLHTQLRMWHEYMEGAIQSAIDFIQLAQYGLENTEEIRKEISRRINLAGECFYQFGLKMDMFKRMPALIEKISSQRSIEAVNRRRICSSTEPLELENQNAKFPIASLSFKKETLRAIDVIAIPIISHVLEGTNVPSLPQPWDIDRITDARPTIRQLREAILTQQPQPILRAVSALYMKMRAYFDKMPIPGKDEEDWYTTVQQLYSRIKLILDENIKGKKFAMAYVDILGFRQLTIDEVSAGKYMHVEDAREAWWNTVNSGIQRVLIKEAFFSPVGGDGWLLYTLSPRHCLEMIDSLSIELRNSDWNLPCIGVGFGPAKPTGAGAYDMEAILAYLAGDNKDLRGFGKVVVTESVYKNVVEEDNGFAVHFKLVGKIKAPRPGAEEVPIYDYYTGN